MSEGRGKLGDFSLLKSLVGGSKLSDNTAKLRDVKIKKFSKSDSPALKTEQVKKDFVKNKPTITSEIQGTIVRIPQYGQTISLKIINEMTNPSASQEEIVVHVDTDKEKSKEEQRLLRWLCTRFSKCFNTINKKPLKVGISQDIEVIYQNEFNASIDPFILRNVLRRYVGDTRYQQSVFDLKKRYNLRGEVVEGLSADHVEYAKRRLEEIAEKADLRAKGIDIRTYYQEKKAEKEKQNLENIENEKNNTAPVEPLNPSE